LFVDEAMAAVSAQEREADNAVVRRSLREPEAFIELFERYADDVHRYALRRLGADAADDVMAETFTVAFAQRGRFDLSRVDARPWLFSIATNLIRGQRRAELRRWRAMARAGVAPDEEREADRVAARLTAQGARGQLAAALASLSPDQRDALLLYAWTELNYEQIAEALGVPTGTVRSRLHRARGGLRDELRLLRDLHADASPVAPRTRLAARARLGREFFGAPAPPPPRRSWSGHRTAWLFVALTVGGVLVVVARDVV
jgi:RNA polymerase sigma factor (sigma-70 family)